MALHFSKEEFEKRKLKTLQSMKEQDLNDNKKPKYFFIINVIILYSA